MKLPAEITTGYHPGGIHNARFSPKLLVFLGERGWSSLADWCDYSGVKKHHVYQARQGRPLAQKHVEALARTAKVEPDVVRDLLCEFVLQKVPRK